MAASGSHLVEEFEATFQNCLAALTSHEHLNTGETDETKMSVDQCMQRYLDIAKQLECFFLQKRLILSIHKPEQIIKEDISDLHQELQRKEALLQKHSERLVAWQAMLSRHQAAPAPPPGVAQTQVPAAQPPQAQPTPAPQQSAPSPVPSTQHTPPSTQTMPPPAPSQHQQAPYLQGPLAYLQQTTSNIGLPERR